MPQEIFKVYLEEKVKLISFTYVKKFDFIVSDGLHHNYIERSKNAEYEIVLKDEYDANGQLVKDEEKKVIFSYNTLEPNFKVYDEKITHGVIPEWFTRQD